MPYFFRNIKNIFSVFLILLVLVPCTTKRDFKQKFNLETQQSGFTKTKICNATYSISKTKINKSESSLKRNNSFSSTILTFDYIWKPLHKSLPIFSFKEKLPNYLLYQQIII